MVVPTGGLHLHVLADHIKAQGLGDLDIVGQCLVRRRGVQAVGPPSLVEGAELEQDFVVQQQLRTAVRILADRNLPHAEVARDLVDHGTVADHLHRQIVEVGRSGRPQLAPGTGRLTSSSGLAVVRDGLAASRTMKRTASAEWAAGHRALTRTVPVSMSGTMLSSDT